MRPVGIARHLTRTFVQLLEEMVNKLLSSSVSRQQPPCLRGGGGARDAAKGMASATPALNPR